MPNKYMPYLVFNKQEWLLNEFFNFTEKEIDAADKNGFIAIKHKINCYLTRPVWATSKKHGK